MNFTELNLHPDLQKSIDDAGYIECMPVQAQVFPHAFAGEDIYAQSQTGTGKTAAFLVSILQRIMTEPEQTNTERSSSWRLRGNLPLRSWTKRRSSEGICR